MGKKAPTIGYWFLDAWHQGICRGPVDAYLEMRGGDRTAWQGRLTESGRITIAAEDLYGGEKGEGGIAGDVDIMFGEADQAPNDYLTSVFGGDQTAHRGKLSVVFRGAKTGALNPYPKKTSHKFERILADWPGDDPWYPEKAVVALSSGEVLLPEDAEDWEFQTMAHHSNPGYENLTEPSGGWSTGPAPFSGGTTATSGSVWPIKTILWARKSVTVPSGSNARRLIVRVENGCVVFVNGVLIGSVNRDNIQIDANQNNAFTFTLAGGATYNIVIKAFDEVTPSGGGTFLTIVIDSDGLNAINPAHMLYESIILPRELGGQGEPAGLINDASFTAAADKLYSEGFGLCTKWYRSESAEDFQDRILNIIGGFISQSRVDGQYYLDLVRSDYVIDDLLVIAEADVADYQDVPASLSESVNRIVLGWFDPQQKQNRTTSPVTSLAAVQSAGGVISETITHREIPIEGLALRKAGMELRARTTPRTSFDLTTNRKPVSLRKGQYFRLQMPSEGIADMVCLAAEIDYGELNGKMKIAATSAVDGLSNTVFVTGNPGLDTSGEAITYASPHQRIFEAPYIELARTLSNSDLSDLAPEAGYLATLATRPQGNAINYSIFSAADGEAYADRGTADWSPTATINEAAPLEDPLPTDFTLADGVMLDRVEVGSAALWGDEIVRVDAIDTSVDPVTVSLGRACADTVPQTHAAGDRIYFYGDEAGTDARQYVDGETVSAKLLTRTAGARLDLASAVVNTTIMDSRHARPYAPGKVRIDGSAWPSAVTGEFVVTWAHRDRILQADQLLDTEASSVGPEATARIALQLIDDATDAVLVEKLDVAGDTATCDLAASGDVRLVLYSISDLGESWQRHEHVFAFTAAGGTDSIDAETYAVPTWVIDGNGG